MIYVMELKEVLAKNIGLLQKVTGHSGNEMGRLCGISGRMVSHIKNLEANASIEILSRISHHYKIPAWLLLVKNLKADDLLDTGIGRLVEDYIKTDRDGRKSLLSLADREAFLSEKVPPPPNLETAQDKKKSS